MNDDRTRIAVRGSAVSIGTELNQTYRIDSLLGVGGMGEVFKGHNIQTGDPVAIKIVLPEFAQDETILGLFRKEARILNHLYHDAIVRYYVFSIDPALSRPYLAMEFVDGPSLAAHVKSAPITASDFMPLLRRLADGLHRAHLAGVIHRDMSPDNVILPGGLVQNAKIIDFGIARSANVGGETLLGGSFAGKYNFVSPEQLGLYGGEVTPKSDIYSLALVMSAAMRGRPLEMSGSQVDIIEKRRIVPDLTGVPKQFHPVLSAMLASDPVNRPADMAAIRDWPDASPAPKQPSGKPKAEKPKSSPPAFATNRPAEPSHALRNGVFAIAVVTVIGLGALGGWIYTQRDMPSNNVQLAKTEPVKSNQTTDKPPTDTTSTTNGQQSTKAQLPTTQTTAQDEHPTPPPPDSSDGGSKSAKTEPSSASPSTGKTPTPPPTGPGAQQSKTEPPGTDKPAQSQPPAIDAGKNTNLVTSSTPPSGRQAANDGGSTSPVTQSTKTTSVASKSVGEKTPTPQETGTPNNTSQIAKVDAAPPPSKTPTTSGGTGAQQQAALPAVITPPPPLPTASALKDFVSDFSKGNCFAATADSLTATSASITALASAGAGQSFADAFQKKAGFAPNLTLDPVSDQQCSFVNALHGMSVAGTSPLNISLSKSDIRGGDADKGTPGDPLTVSVSGAGDRNIYLFVMDHRGGIQNINRLCPSCITMKTGEIAAALSLSTPSLADGESAPPFYPMLVFAVASPKPLISINSQDAFEADDFIAPFLQEIAGAKDVTTAVSFLKLRGQ